MNVVHVTHLDIIFDLSSFFVIGWAENLGILIGRYYFLFETKYSRMDQVSFFYKGCLQQILLGPFLNTFPHLSFRPTICNLPEMGSIIAIYDFFRTAVLKKLHEKGFLCQQYGSVWMLKWNCTFSILGKVAA